jgi:hypothetical protein
MATRMQQRRGTAAQWTSANPVLNAGEIGWESDTNKFKIGDGTNHWANIDYFIDANSTVNPSFGTSIVFEGATADSYETTLQVTDPTADRTITFPDATGTVVLADGSGNVTVSGNLTVSGTTTTINSTTINATTGIIFEGLTADAHETTLTVTDPTADRTITFPDATGTVQLRVTDVSDTEIGYLNGVTSAIQTQLDDKSTASKTETLTNKTITSPVISSITNGAATLTLPSSTGTIALTTDIPAGVVTDSGTQTLTNKTLTSPVVSGLTLSDSSIVIEGSSANDFETTLTVTDPTADRTITLPDVTGTVVTTGNLSAITSVGTLASLTVTGDLTVNGTTTTINSTTLTVDDKNIVLGDVETPTDTTADGGGITLKGATDKTFNWVDATDSWTSSEHVNLASGKSYYVNGTLLKDLSETLTNKTLTTPVISSISNTGTLTLPTDTDTLVGRATTDTLTNKTLSSAVATTALTLNATAELRLADTDSSHYVGFKAPGTVTSNKVWVLPAADGTTGQVLSTNGSGTLSWSTAGGGASFSELMLIGA